MYLIINLLKSGVRRRGHQNPEVRRGIARARIGRVNLSKYKSITINDGAYEKYKKTIDLYVASGMISITKVERGVPAVGTIDVAPEPVIVVLDDTDEIIEAVVEEIDAELPVEEELTVETTEAPAEKPEASPVSVIDAVPEPPEEHKGGKAKAVKVGTKVAKKVD